jgi:hypothetical protein
MRFLSAAEPQVGPLAVKFNTDNHATRTEVIWIRLREVLLYWYPEIFVAEESELIDILILTIWSNRFGNRLV